MRIAGLIAGLFGLAVLFGVGQQVLKNPNSANTVIASGVSDVETVTKGLEGR